MGAASEVGPEVAVFRRDDRGLATTAKRNARQICHGTCSCLNLPTTAPRCFATFSSPLAERNQMMPGLGAARVV